MENEQHVPLLPLDLPDEYCHHHLTTQTRTMMDHRTVYQQTPPLWQQQAPQPHCIPGERGEEGRIFSSDLTTHNTFTRQGGLVSPGSGWFSDGVLSGLDAILLHGRSAPHTLLVFCGESPSTSILPSQSSHTPSPSLNFLFTELVRVDSAVGRGRVL